MSETAIVKKNNSIFNTEFKKDLGESLHIHIKEMTKYMKSSDINKKLEAKNYVSTIHGLASLGRVQSGINHLESNKLAYCFRVSKDEKELKASVSKNMSGFLTEG